MPEEETKPLLGKKSFAALVSSEKAKAALGKLMQGKPKSKEHLVYNPHYLTSWAIFTARFGTVFSDRKIWYITAGLIAVAMGSGTMLFLAVPRPQDLETDFLFEVVLYFKVFIAFMLGLFMQSCLKRWFACMVALTDFLLAIRKLSWMLDSAGVPADQRDAAQRYMILSCYLLENEITGIWVDDPEKVKARWTALASYLTEERLVHDYELVLLESEVDHDQRAARVWIWIGQIVTGVDKQYMAAPMKGALMGTVNEATKVIMDIKNYVQFQLPYMYCQMLAFFVHLNNILIALACGAAVAVTLATLGSDGPLGEPGALAGALAGGHGGHGSQDHGDSGGDAGGGAADMHLFTIAGHVVRAYWDDVPRRKIYRAVQAILGQLFILLIQPIIYQAFLEISSTLCDPFTHPVYGMPLHQNIEELRLQIMAGNLLAAQDLDTIEADYAETKKQKLQRLMRKHGHLKGAEKDPDSVGLHKSSPKRGPEH